MRPFEKRNTTTMTRPLGVLGVIAPWNYPFHNVYNHIVSGIFAGNAVVSKVSEYTCWSSRCVLDCHCRVVLRPRRGGRGVGGERGRTHSSVACSCPSTINTLFLRDRALFLLLVETPRIYGCSLRSFCMCAGEGKGCARLLLVLVIWSLITHPLGDGALSMFGRSSCFFYTWYTSDFLLTLE